MEQNPTLQVWHHNAGWQKEKKSHCCAADNKTEI